MNFARFRQISAPTWVLLGTVSIAFASLQAHADGSSSFSRLRAGILGGLAVTGSTVSSGTSPNLYSSSAQVGYKAGIEADYELVPDLAGIEADVLYTQYSWIRDTLGSSVSLTPSSNWWEIPLFANYTGLQWFKFGMGPVLDFASSQVSSNGWGSFSAGIAAQAALDYPIGPKWVLNADLRYLLGLTNLYDDGSTNDLKLHSFDVLAGIQYRL